MSCRQCDPPLMKERRCVFCITPGSAVSGRMRDHDDGEPCGGRTERSGLRSAPQLLETYHAQRLKGYSGKPIVFCKLKLFFSKRRVSVVYISSFKPPRSEKGCRERCSLPGNRNRAPAVRDSARWRLEIAMSRRRLCEFPGLGAEPQAAARRFPLFHRNRLTQKRKKGILKSS